MAMYARDGHHQSLRCRHGRPSLLPFLLLLLLAVAAAPLFSTHIHVSALATPLYATSRDVGDAAAWISGHASFYGGHDAAGTMGDACGYGNVYSMGYGVTTVALSAPLFKGGASCGACFEIKCKSSFMSTNDHMRAMLSTHEHKHEHEQYDNNCLSGEPSIVVTATNLCPPNSNVHVPNELGGWCNLPLHHFNLAEPLFHTIAHSPTSIMPILYRRVVCERRGGIHFTIYGHPTFNMVLVSNVGGAGDVQSLAIKGSSHSKWITMKRTWGQNWQSYGSLLGQSISFRVKTSDEKVLISYDVVPKYWEFGQTFEGDQFQ